MKKLLQSLVLLLAALAVPLAANAGAADVNGDGEVSIADINVIINAILNGTAADGADVNGDGEVTLADINAVVSAILDGTTPTPPPGPGGDYGGVREELLNELSSLGMNINYGNQPPILDGAFIAEPLETMVLYGPWGEWIPLSDDTEYSLEPDEVEKMIIVFEDQEDDRISVVDISYEVDEDGEEDIDVMDLDMYIMGQGNKFTICLYFTFEFRFEDEGIGVIYSGEVSGQNIKNLQVAAIDENLPDMYGNRYRFIQIWRDVDGISYPTEWDPDDYILAPKTDRAKSIITSPLFKKITKSLIQRSNTH